MRREGFFPQLAIHGPKPLTEMIANGGTEIDFVLWGYFRQRLHEIPRRNSDGCSHVLPPIRTVADQLRRPIGRNLWLKISATLRLSIRA
jgi:hypothetical protein